jgi:ABC-type glycerol-3-phosphate transport system permease component
VDNWTPQTQQSDRPVDMSGIDMEVYRGEMIQGLFDVLSERISDEARAAALVAQKRADGLDETAPANLVEELSDAAVRIGVDALVRDAEGLLDDKLLEQTFEACYRRFCLGECRLRTEDYRTIPYSQGGDWVVVDGPAELQPRKEMGKRIQEGQLRFEDAGQTVTFELANNLVDARPEEITRLYVSYRGDATWARVVFEVVRAGELFRTPEVVTFSDRSWVETQLQWHSGEKRDSMERRTYLYLTRAGSAPAGSPPFALRMHVTRNSYLGAWRDKILNHYRTVFRELPFARYIMTSLALSILSIVLSIFSCTLVAYAFARLHWPGRDMCFGIMLATMMIPPQVTMIPGFLIFKHLGWYNTLLPLWVGASFGSAFFIFLLRQFLKTIPQDLEDAARIDGCGFLRIYWHVMLPLVRPTIAIVAIYTFIGVWNNFMGPLIYVNDERLFPLALGLFKFSLRSGGDVGLMMAASFVMTMPIIILFFFVQRYFIQGITLTGMKG